MDNHIRAIQDADLVIAMNYESKKVMETMQKQKKLYEAFEEADSMVIDVPKKTDRSFWKDTANTIESACRKL